MGKRQVEKYIKEYIHRLQKDIKPEKVILYGSVKKGTYHDGSDVDLIVVSDYFSKLDDDDRLDILYRKTVRLPLDFHLYALTPQEVKNVSPLTSLALALKDGVTVNN